MCGGPQRAWALRAAATLWQAGMAEFEGGWAAALEEARASGDQPSTIVVGYHPRISIGGGDGRGHKVVQTEFVVQETARRSFQGFEDMMRRAAEKGVRLLDCRAIN